MWDSKRDTDVLNSLLDSVGEGEGGMLQENLIKTYILSRVKQITSPGWMCETSARTWCTWKTQRNRVEREVGGGIGMVNTCKSMLIYVNVWQKPLQYCKVISLHLIKINGGEKSKQWYIYTMEYYSAIKKNSFQSVLMRWMKLEPIIQSEVRQKEKHQYSTLMHIYRI